MTMKQSPLFYLFLIPVNFLLGCLLNRPQPTHCLIHTQLSAISCQLMHVNPREVTLFTNSITQDVKQN